MKHISDFDFSNPLRPDDMSSGINHGEWDWRKEVPEWQPNEDDHVSETPAFNDRAPYLMDYNGNVSIGPFGTFHQHIGLYEDEHGNDTESENKDRWLARGAIYPRNGEFVHVLYNNRGMDPAQYGGDIHDPALLSEPGIRKAVEQRFGHPLVPANIEDESYIGSDWGFQNRPDDSKMAYVPSKATVSPSKTTAVLLKVLPLPKPGQVLEGVTERLADWREDQHPRGSEGKFVAKHEQHEVKEYSEKGKHAFTHKRCVHCGVTYFKKHGQGRVECPTCGEDPERKLRLTKHFGADATDALATSLDWRFLRRSGNGHRMYSWQDLDGVNHVVTAGSGAHGESNEQMSADRTRQRMNRCMSGTCNHSNLGNVQQIDEPGAPMLKAGQEVTYGGQQWWIINADGELSSIYNANGKKIRVPTNKLQFAANEERIERNRKFLEEIEERWEDREPDRDPDFVFVWFGGALKMEAWDVNLRVRQMAEEIIKEHGYLDLMDYEAKLENDGTIRWVTGEVWRDSGELKFKITDLADPQEIEYAKAAVKEYLEIEENDSGDLYPLWTEAPTTSV